MAAKATKPPAEACTGRRGTKQEMPEAGGQGLMVRRP
jgi:hypothetical protein